MKAPNDVFTCIYLVCIFSPCVKKSYHLSNTIATNSLGNNNWRKKTGSLSNNGHLSLSRSLIDSELSMEIIPILSNCSDRGLRLNRC